MRIAVVGHRTYFENHYPEGWKRDSNILCMDVDEGHYGWLNIVGNFRPDLTLFYRPELYPRKLVARVPGLRIAFLSEPVPNIVDGALEETEETRLRTMLYGRMSWDAFDYRVFYDPSKAQTVRTLGYPVDEFRELPINTDWFRPPRGGRQLWDVSFVGKATPHRIAVLDFLRSSPFRFLWVAHGVSGKELASIFRRSRITLNIHADGKPAIEPRIYLAAACGTIVLSETLSSRPTVMEDRIVDMDRWNSDMISGILESLKPKSVDQSDLDKLSVRTFLTETAEKFNLR